MKIGTANLYAETAGSGPPLILVHGTALSHETFKPTLESASEFATVVFYDQRGCGRSSPIAEGQSVNLEDFVSDLEEIRTGLGYERMFLLGHSWGAYLALAYAIEFEKRLKKLILVSPATPYHETEEQIHSIHKRLTPAMREQIQRITLSNLTLDEKANRRMEVTLPLYFHNLVAMEDFRRRGIRISGKVSEILSNVGFYRDLRPDLPRLRIPVKILVGRNDRRTPVEYSEEIRRHLYDAEVEILDGCGHFPFLERPNLFLKLLKKVIAGDWARRTTA